jgi:integrase
MNHESGKAMRGMGRAFKRGKSWWIAYCHRGEEVRESVAKALQVLRASESDAYRLLKRRIGEIHGGKYVGIAQERLIFGEALDALEVNYANNGRRSLDTLKAHLKHVRAAFGMDRAVDITEARIERYKAERLAAKRAPATINRELAAIKRAFHIAVKQKRVSTMPAIEMLAEHNARQGFFERGEFEALCANLPPYLRDFTHFAYLSGWRRGEVASLTWADVDREARIIRLRPEASKNGEGRTLALEGELWDLIERRWQGREYKTSAGSALATLVFHRKGEPVGDFRKAWETACDEAQVPGRLFHDLRRTAVRNMVRAGVPQSVAMRISGHRTAAVFRRYDITTEADIREAVRRTQAHIASQAHAPSNVLAIAKSTEVAG